MPRENQQLASDESVVSRPAADPAAGSLRAIGVGVTDVGRRREHNEDSLLVSYDLGLFAVADGMGGHQAGDIASTIAAASLEDYVFANAEGAEADRGEDIPADCSRLLSAVQHANAQVFARSGRSATKGGMGTTVVSVLFSPNDEQLHVVHVGDSRCYRFRNDVLELLTMDHSMINEALKLNPNLPAEILKQLPSNVVTRALGTGERVEPDNLSVQVALGDVYILCSDGLNGEITDDDIADELRSGLQQDTTLETQSQNLIDQANRAGGNDNVSVVLVRIEEADADPPARVDPTGSKPGSGEITIDVEEASIDVALESYDDLERLEELAGARAGEVTLDPEEGGREGEPLRLAYPILDVGVDVPTPTASEASSGPAKPPQKIPCRDCDFLSFPYERFCGLCGADHDLSAQRWPFGGVVDSCRQCEHDIYDRTRYCVACGYRHLG